MDFIDDFTTDISVDVYVPHNFIAHIGAHSKVSTLKCLTRTVILHTIEENYLDKLELARILDEATYLC